MGSAHPLGMSKRDGRALSMKPLLDGLRPIQGVPIGRLRPSTRHVDEVAHPSGMSQGWANRFYVFGTGAATRGL